MGGNARLKRQRDKLFIRQQGKCHWCGEQMTNAPTGVGKIPDNQATLEHLDDRFSPLRGKRRGRRHVAACKSCNQIRGRESEKSQPIEVLWLRSNRSMDGFAEDNLGRE